MGADMLLYSTPLPRIDGEPSHGPEARRHVTDAIETWRPDSAVARNVCDAAGDCAYSVTDECFGEDADALADILANPADPLHERAVERFRGLLRDALDEVWEANPHVHPNREVACYGDNLVTGGLSFGDWPTDAAASVALLAASGVTDLTITTPEGAERARRTQVSDAVETIHSQLGDRDAELFQSLAARAGLQAACEQCGWLIRLDEADQACGRCGQAGQHPAGAGSPRD